MKTLAMVMVTMCLIGSPLWAEYDEPTFGGLVEAESVSVSRYNERVPHELDPARIYEHLQRADTLVADIFAEYKNILTKAERDEGKFFRTWDKERYTAMKSASAAFQRKIKELNEELVAVDALFAAARQEALPQQIHIDILERLGHHVRNVTIYNTFVDFGTARKLRFDTMTPMNELTAHLLGADVKTMAFPTLYLPSLHETEAFGDAYTDERGIVHEQRSVTMTDAVLHLPLDEDNLRESLATAKELVEKATEAREKLIASGAKEITRNQFSGRHNSIEYTCKLEDFEGNHKPEIINFTEAMVKLKAHCNDLTARLSVSRNFIGDLNIRSEWEQLSTRFNELTEWGDTWIVTYDPWNKIERWFTFFPGERFGSRHLFSDLSVRTPAQRQLELARRRSGKFPTSEVISILSALSSGYRYNKAKELAPDIYDLTTANALEISRYLSSSYHKGWLDFVMALPNYLPGQ